MPPLTEQEYLAGAQARTIPARTAEQLIHEISRTLVPVIDLTPQSSRCEWSEAEVTLSTTATPKFVLPANAFDETTIYRFIGVKKDVNPSTSTYHVDVEYPGMTDPQREDFQANTSDMFNMLSLSAGSNARGIRNARPLIVYPEGVLRISQDGDSAIDTVVRLQILREVVGGCGRSERAPGLITASEN